MFCVPPIIDCMLNQIQNQRPFLEFDIKPIFSFSLSEKTFEKTVQSGWPSIFLSRKERPASAVFDDKASK